VSQNLVLGAEAIPADKFDFRPNAGVMSFAELLTDVSGWSYWSCGAIGGVSTPSRPRVAPSDGKAAVVARLKETFAFCERALEGLADSTFAEVRDWGGMRSRASLVTEITSVWAERYAQLALGLRLNGRVPPTPCVGGRDCDSGQHICKPTTWGEASGSLTLSDAPYSVRSDGRGPYVNGTGNVHTVGAVAAALLFGSPEDARAAPPRSITVDLSHPVPGDIGVPLGVVTAGAYVDFGAQWYSEANGVQHSVIDIPVGTTVTAAQLGLGFPINGVAHALQMGPQPWGHCFSDGTAVHGAGTTRATIARPTATRFVIDLPAGSIGRLFDIHLHDPNAINKGLYYVSLHFVVDR